MELLNKGFTYYDRYLRKDVVVCSWDFTSRVLFDSISGKYMESSKSLRGMNIDDYTMYSRLATRKEWKF